MDYLGRSDRIARRENLELILPHVKSVVCCTLFYWPGKSGFPKLQQNPLNGAISSYAWGADYHAVFGEKLKKLAEWMHQEAGGKGRWYVDTGAIMERDLGERSGLGFVGKNTLLIHPSLGSGFFLGEILTTLPLPQDSPLPELPPRRRQLEIVQVTESKHEPPTAPRQRCGACKQCQIKCPTNALSKEFVIDARRCISYLTIELKGSIPTELRSGMGNKVYGCDVCQQVCPYNRFDWSSHAAASEALNETETVASADGLSGHSGKSVSPMFGAVSDSTAAPDLVQLASMNEVEFKHAFGNTAILRIGVVRMRRNALVALGNIPRSIFDELPESKKTAILRVLQEPCTDIADESAKELLREHATWALSRLQNDTDSASFIQ
uniref:4Fe-4S ferredoxin-type domain-containing protein n=1 Tax=Timspurckia oligopyrenoides TaxID=708627 RepID=A0A7S1ER57_9RHOD|mmetsp:Transcript_1727/g.3059  ORF Transcript_1727/g.3059 Transcript_1727/m.3059 type:complete len:380 (+) Transcript_1727:432-1571(+)